ncbi:MAG: AMP-binding enzyme, partial [Vibrio sp.]
PGSVGLPLPYVKVRIVDVDQNGNYVRDCDTNEAGCVVISGPNVFSGYAKAQHNIGQWVEEGWFNTGDLGRLDENGYLWLTGRSKDIIIRGGHNIDPQMIEEAYYKHPQVNEAVAIGKPDIRVGELPIVYLQVKDGCKLSAQDFIEFGKSHIPERAAVPKEVHFIDQVPVTAVGKVFKPTLRDKTTLEVVQHELSLLNIEASDVSVEQDKQYGQCVHIHCDRSEHSKIEHQIGQYAFKLCLYP